MIAYITTGKLTDAQTVTLDEPLPLAPTRVRVVVEPLATRTPRPYRVVIDAIRDRQRDRGHHPPTREAVDRYLAEERASWGA